MAWNHLYFSAIQAVSFPALNSTLFKDEIHYFGVLTGCKTHHPVMYFAGNELQIIYVGSNWAVLHTDQFYKQNM